MTGARSSRWRCSVPVAVQHSTGGRCWTRSACSTRIFSPIWKMWIWRGGRGGPDGAACMCRRRGCCTAIRPRRWKAPRSRAISLAATRFGCSPRITPAAPLALCAVVVLYDLLAVIFAVITRRDVYALRGRLAALADVRWMWRQQPTTGDRPEIPFLAPLVAPWRVTRRYRHLTPVCF